MKMNKTTPPLASYCVCNTMRVNIWKLDKENERVLVSLNLYKRAWCKLRTDRDGNIYFVKYRCKYLLADFTRL